VNELFTNTQLLIGLVAIVGWIILIVLVLLFFKGASDDN